MTRNACSITLRRICSEAGRVGSRLKLGALPCGLMLLPVVHGEKYASDAGFVNSRLRFAVILIDVESPF